ncbi:hypothetical protein OV208_12445 [Corallococcus sp. bb12-1]|uniref:hypothetical protein n=1 Tax=Corallococcus sp. bb12-1 TaxID=2996784 RepID=UPI00226DF16F|nr:hypothetical protein [Corallococcus sp. bb12-1]MCY1042126.1 hypothetical protein [Corallococcus sp. bb12-1]
MPNPADLCLAATVADDLGVAVTPRLESLVTAASRAVAGYCGRVFEYGEGLVEYPAGYGRPLLLLERPPVVLVVGVWEGGVFVPAEEYESHGKLADAGMLYRKGGVWPMTARLGGQVVEMVDSFQGESGDAGLRVVYDGGFVTPGQRALDASRVVTLPEDVQEATILTAVQLYRSRGVDSMVASESIGDWSVSYFAAKAEGKSSIPGTAQALLAPYVMHRVS